jgi:hypothetical protein
MGKELKLLPVFYVTNFKQWAKQRAALVWEHERAQGNEEVYNNTISSLVLVYYANNITKLLMEFYAQKNSLTDEVVRMTWTTASGKTIHF